jgi:hypothetical protein
MQTAQKTITAVAIVASLGLFGCDKLGGDKQGAGPESNTGALGETSAKAGGGKPAVNANGVPMIPTGRSAPPSLEEWGAAIEVNTQGAGSRPRDCYMKTVREWLKVHCEGSVKGIIDMDGFGNKGSDYFEYLTPGKVADYIVRLRKGSSMKLKILREDQDAALFVSWPPSAEQPLHVALGIGKR